MVFKCPLMPQSEINVCHEDQLKINLFARKNSHLCDLNEQIEKKQVWFVNVVCAVLLLTCAERATELEGCF